MTIPLDENTDKPFLISARTTTIIMIVLTALLTFIDDGHELLNGEAAQWVGHWGWNLFFSMGIPYLIVRRNKSLPKRDRSYLLWCVFFFVLQFILLYSASKR
jgi:hypothetical protein